jgi:hypothetical protein
MDRAVRLRAASAVITVAACLLPFWLLPSARAEGGNFPPIAQLANGLPSEIVVSGNYAYVAAHSVVTAFDVSNPSNPRLVGYCDTPGHAKALAVSNGYLYIAAYSAGLRVLRISDPAHPVAVGACETYGQADGVAVTGGVAYLADGNAGLAVVAVSDPANPVKMAVYEPSSRLRAVAAEGRYAYVVGDGCGLRVVDVSDPGAPVEVGRCGEWNATGLAVRNGYAYLAAASDGVVVVDVRNPADPREVARVRTRNIARRIAVSEKRCYVGDHEGGLLLFDLSDPAHPVEVTSVNLSGWSYGVAAAGDRLYVANCTGIGVLDAKDMSQPKLVGHFATYGGACDVAIAGGLLALADYSIGLRLLDVTQQDRPMELKQVHVAFGARVAALPRYGYIVGKFAEFYLIDTSDATNTTATGPWRLSAQADEFVTGESCVYVANRERGLGLLQVLGRRPSIRYWKPPQTCSIVGVAVQGGCAYAADAMGRLWIIGLAGGRGQPRTLGVCELAGPPQAVAVSGRYAYIAAARSGLHVVDVSDPARPRVVGHVATPDSASAVAVAGGYAYVACEDAGLRVINVSDPARPMEIAYWDTPGQAQRVVVSNGRVFLADRTWGLVVFPEVARVELPAQ